MSQKLPPPEEIQFSNVHGMIDATGNGKITLQGLAKGHESLEAVVTNLVDETHKIPNPKALKIDGADKYKWTFNNVITVVNVTEEEAAKKKLAATRRTLRPRILSN